jgi:hypothetical protein
MKQLITTFCLVFFLLIQCRAQDSSYYKYAISAGYYGSKEIFYHMIEGDKDGDFTYTWEKDFKLKSEVLYLKLMRKRGYRLFEEGFSIAFSIGKVTNLVGCTHPHNTPDTCYAERNRYAASIMYRRNYFLLDKKHFQLYGGVGAGLRATVYTNYNSTDNYWSDDDLVKAFCPIAFESVAGLRILPVKYVGIYIEAGFAKSVLQGGLTIRF